MSASSFPITRSTKVVDCDFSIRAWTALKGAELHTIGDVLAFARIDDGDLKEMAAAQGTGASYRLRKKLERIRGCGYTTASSLVTEISRVAERELRMTTSVAPVVTAKMRAHFDELNSTHLKKLHEAIEKELWWDAAAYCEVLAKIKNIV